ncbi:hypothetical protein L1887_05876 [Cichorium endivia]|nr:hypothetical protein L1887_05876 [Cichorium endivia]
MLSGDGVGNDERLLAVLTACTDVPISLHNYASLLNRFICNAVYPHPPHVDSCSTSNALPLQQYPPENHLTCRPLSAAPSLCSSSNVAVSYRNCTASVQLLPPGIRSFLLYGVYTMSTSSSL